MTMHGRTKRKSKKSSTDSKVYIPQDDHEQRHLRNCDDEGHEEEQHEEGEDGGAGRVAGARRGHRHHRHLAVLARAARRQRRRARAAHHRAQPRHLAHVLVHAWRVGGRDGTLQHVMT